MNPLLLFEAGQGIKRWPLYITSLLMLSAGIFCGNRFNLTAGEGIYFNSPYTTGFMTGLLSLSVIFIAVIFSYQFLSRDQDSGFGILLFSFPVSEKTYLTGKFAVLYISAFGGFLLLMAGFIAGQHLRTGNEMQPGFSIWSYCYPVVIFGAVNSFLVCTFLFLIAVVTRKKLMVVAGGLFLYIVYMIILMFSNSPFMSGSLPQSPEIQQISALSDPFGLSAYFLEAQPLSPDQKNTVTVPFSGYLLLNRIFFIMIALSFLLPAFRLFRFSLQRPGKNRKKNAKYPGASLPAPEHLFILTEYMSGYRATGHAIVSFMKTDLIYLCKNTGLSAAFLLVLFYTGMEIYAAIDQGIRIPQQYAGSGLIAESISANFYFPGMIIVVYCIHDLYWRSRLSGFYPIEKSTVHSGLKSSGHLLAIGTLLVFLMIILIVQGLIFQSAFLYFHVDWDAYLCLFLFCTFPMILFAAFILLINETVTNRYAALGISASAILILSGPVSKTLLPYPLLRIFSGYNGSYSDFFGYGPYAAAFAGRLIFGACLLAVIWLIRNQLGNRKTDRLQTITAMVLVLAGGFSGSFFMNGYRPENRNQKIMEQVVYEKVFRKYGSLPQPVITEVRTEIQLYPSRYGYSFKGTYVLMNRTPSPIAKILVNFHPDLKLDSAAFRTSSEKTMIREQVREILLKQPLLPGKMAYLDFSMSYRWFPVNGHDSFNAILENGSFMRISRYYPLLGYQKSRETEDPSIRSKNRLGKVSGLRPLNIPACRESNFINLDMTVFTDGGQTAVGTGDLVEQSHEHGRNRFRYRAQGIPFRFAVSSAKYAVRSLLHNGITIRILYHPDHAENVSHLMQNACLGLDYCTENFGKYPFKSISFAEVSSFTGGFAATSYPSVVFMPENKLFHARLKAGSDQDVINELAGHELSHSWWGNSSIDPDDRPGSTMLTETLAMYTEMMLCKKLYGKQKMKEKLDIHRQMYEEGKGLMGDQPLFKVTPDHHYIAYSKGALAMVALSELIGEQKVNKALRQFLIHNRYPEKPVSTDLIREFHSIVPEPRLRKKIDSLFMN